MGKLNSSRNAPVVQAEAKAKPKKKAASKKK